MKKYIGRDVQFVVEGFPRPFVATVVDDTSDQILVRIKDEPKEGEEAKPSKRILHLIKSKVCSFMPTGPDVIEAEVKPLLVLHCSNPSIGCPGVQCIKSGEGFSQNDFLAFMKPCPKRCGTCRTGSKGDLRAIDGKYLSNMLDGTMYGDYPGESE